MVRLFRFFSLFWVLFVASPAWLDDVSAAEEVPAELKDVTVEPVLGSQLNLDLSFVAEDGSVRPLRSYFDRRKPVLLVLSYYGCPMLCGLLLNSLKESLQRFDWLPGDHYEIVTISIDPKESFLLARAKKKSILDATSNQKFREAAMKGWHFLVGKAGSERSIAETVGFRYKWDEKEKQWAHGAAIFLLSPNGRLSRVLYGLDFPPLDLKLGLLEAGEGKVGTIAEKILLFCYHYDPKGNKYTILASRLMSLGGAVTVVTLFLAWSIWFIRLRRKGNACPVSR